MFRVAVITSSDSGYAGLREDKSAPMIKRILESTSLEVIYERLFPDEFDLLKEELIRICDKDEVDLILTTGGTGLSPRDCIPEVTMEVIEREVPGIPEAMRMHSLQITKRAMLSRAVAGVRKNTLIINLPGSPKAVKECLDYMVDEIQHGLEILRGCTGNCARI